MASKDRSALLFQALASPDHAKVHEGSIPDAEFINETRSLLP